MDNRSRTALPVILAMAILVVGLVYGLFIRPNFHRIAGVEITFDALRVQSINTNLGETVSRMGDFLYVASKEGLTKVDQQGESVWNKTYHLNDPLFLVEAPYIAIVGLADKEALILDENGSRSVIQTDYDIVGGYLNESGFLTLVQEKDQENLIQLFDADGEGYITRRTIFKKDGYPIDVAMSKNGTKMMTTHLDISQHKIVSKVTFLDFSNDGQAFEDRVVGHVSLNNVMASELVFFADDRGAVVGDRLINFYEMSPVPELLNSIEVGAVVEHVVHTDDHLIVSYGEALVPEGEAMANTVTVYTTDGVQSNQLMMEDQVTGLNADEGTFYIIQSSKVISYKGNAKEWETVLYKPLSEIYHISNDRYLLVFDYDYEIVEIRDV